MSYHIPIRKVDSVVIYASQKTITVLLISKLKYLKIPHALLVAAVTESANSLLLNR